MRRGTNDELVFWHGRVIALATLMLIIVVPTASADGSGIRFAFAKPNDTTVEDAITRLGKPDSDYTAWALEDEIDVLQGACFFSSFRFRKRAQERNVQVIAVRVLEWNIPHRIPGAKFIFRGERLWFAKYPAAPEEITREALTSRYEQEPTIFTLTRQIADTIQSVTVYAYPERGIAYTREVRSDVNRFVFPPTKEQPFGRQSLDQSC